MVTQPVSVFFDGPKHKRFLSSKQVRRPLSRFDQKRRMLFTEPFDAEPLRYSIEVFLQEQQCSRCQQSLADEPSVAAFFRHDGRRHRHSDSSNEPLEKILVWHRSHASVSWSLDYTLLARYIDDTRVRNRLCSVTLV